MTNWGEQIRCPECDGAGWTHESPEDGGDTTCGVCAGSGVVLAMDVVDEDHFAARGER